MTNQEAIEQLSNIKGLHAMIGYFQNGLYGQAIDKAISALEQQPEPERWRDAEWPRDASNPPKEARFSDDRKEWKFLQLTGFSVGAWYSHCTRWNYCQVRDE